MKMNNNQSGNVLFLILIAVALFAALSYAVTRTSRGGGNVERDQLKLDAVQIIQWYGFLRTEILRFSFREGISTRDIRLTDGSSWTHCQTGTDCLWAPEGGGVEYPPQRIRQFFNGWTDSFKDKYESSTSSMSGFTNSHHFFVYLGSDAGSKDLCEVYQDALETDGETRCGLHGSGNYTIFFLIDSE